MRNKIKLDVKGIMWEGTDWIQLDEGRDQYRSVVNTVMNLRVQHEEVSWPAD
jgi:hypothetical protein